MKQHISKVLTKAAAFLFRSGIFAVTLSLVSLSPFAQETVDSSIVGRMKQDATGLLPLVTSDVAKSFLGAVAHLPKETPTSSGYYNRAKREILSEADYLARPDSLKTGFEKREFDEQFYYYTGYGSPLAFVRALDLAGQNGLTDLNGKRIIDFGFGSIGQLRLMASLGAHTTGYEVSPVLQYVYATSEGEIPRVTDIAGKGEKGSVDLQFGNFPADPAIAKSLEGKNGTIDVFFSKNTLKRGYIHPEKEVDPRMLVDLGVSDSVYVKRVYDLLVPGGIFLIYNISPKYTPPTDSNYIPWSDGRCPFEQSLLTATGFKIVSYNQNDTEFVHKMGEPLGWFAKPEDKEGFFGMYTIMKKP